MQGKRPLLAVMSALLLLTLFTQLPFSQTQQIGSNMYCVVTESYSSLGNCIAATIPLGMLGVLLALVLVAIVYMIGALLPNTGLRAWYGNELKEAVKSAIILVIIFSVLAIISGFAVTFMSGGTPATTGSQYDILSSNLQGMYTTIANDYLAVQINYATQAFYKVFGLNAGIAFLKSISISLNFPVPIPLPFPPFPVVASVRSGITESVLQVNTGTFGPTSDPGSSGLLADAAANLIVPVLVTLQMQYDLLFSVIIVGLGVLIPIGMVLRSIPVMRQLGAVFLAFGIGAALVYPSMLLLFNYPVSSYLTPSPSTISNSEACSTLFLSQSLPGGALGSGASQLICNIVEGASADVIMGYANYLPGVSTPDAITSFMTGFGAGLLGLGTVYPALNIIFSVEMVDVVAQFVMFIFDIVISIVIVEDISRALGGPSRLMFGLGRLKLA